MNIFFKMMLSVFILSACNRESNCPGDTQKTDTQQEVWRKEESTMLDSLKTEIVKYGNRDAYEELILWDWNHSSDGIFMYDLIMATEYNDVDAYSNAYHSLLRQYENYGMEYKDLGDNTKEFLLDLLKSGAEGGDEVAQAILNSIKETGEP